MAEQRELELPPRAASLIESLRDVGYTLRTALADVIDNSLTSGARNIHILAGAHDEHPAIGVLDDGTGMSADELFEAMRPGSRSPLDAREANDLGRFGLGLKTASFSQCRRLTVVTRKDGVTSSAVWDLDHVVARDRWLVEIPDDPSGVRWATRLSGDGTLVVWQKLDRLVDRDGRCDRADLVRQLDDAASHIEFVFHRYLSGREGRPVVMSLNGATLVPYDPFHVTHPATQHHPEDVMSLNGREIRIWPITLPHHDKVTAAEWKKYAGPEGYVSNQGFYLYRNRRLIVHGTWFRLARRQELTKLARVGIDIPNTMDAEWKIDIRKAAAQPPPPVRERLRRVVETVVTPSKRTYTRRGSKLTEDGRYRVWSRLQNKNRISYAVNDEHPLIASFSESLDAEQQRRFERLLRLVASGLPFDAMHVDVSANPEAMTAARIEQEDLRHIVLSMWRILKARGISPARARELMRSADPFRTTWSRTLKLIEEMETADGGTE